jgi:hypothetical protein
MRPLSATTCRTYCLNHIPINHKITIPWHLSTTTCRTYSLNHISTNHKIKIPLYLSTTTCRTYCLNHISIHHKITIPRSLSATTCRTYCLTTFNKLHHEHAGWWVQLWSLIASMSDIDVQTLRLNMNYQSLSPFFPYIFVPSITLTSFDPTTTPWFIMPNILSYPGVYSVSNRNEYQEQINNVSSV